MKNVKIAENSGFCFGVKRAESLVQKAIKENKGPIYTLGPLIHNPLVVNSLKEKGVYPISVEELDNISKDSTIIIRSHGIEKKIRKKLEELGLNIIDATCPFVSKAHEAAERFFSKGYKIIVLGDKEHPEVIGILSYIDYKGKVYKNLEEIKKDIEDIKKMEKVALIAQTTQNKNEFNKIIEFLKNENIDIAYENTICNATKHRQDSAIELAEKIDLMIVVGGFNSANTKRLVEISKTKCENVLWIEKSEDLDLEYVKKFKKIGITGGASTPQWSMKQVYDIISKIKVTE